MARSEVVGHFEATAGTVRAAPRRCAAGVILLLLCAPAAVLAQPAAEGTELQINAETSQDQLFPAVVVDTAGGFVVVWESYQDGSYEGIFARRFDAMGAPLSGDLQVNSHTDGAQRYPAIAVDDDGDFVVIWESHGQDDSGSGIFAQRFDSAGMPVGVEFQVNTYSEYAQSAPAVAMTGDGRFVVVWQSSDAQDGDSDGIFGQRFDSAGMPVGVEFQVNTEIAYRQSYPAAAMDASGGFLVVWESEKQDGAYQGIFGQRFDSAGMPQAAEFQVNGSTVDTQTSPSVAAAGAGGFVVVWASYDQGIFGQLVDAGGMALGSEFQVHESTSGALFYPYPKVTSRAAGDFVVTWATYLVHPSDREISGRHFDSAGMPLSGEFPINSTTAMTQTRPALAMNAGGDLVVVWQSFAQDESGYGVFGQRFAAPPPAASIDVDGNGTVGALTDALLILRYVFGFRDAALVNGAVAVDCNRCEAGPIEDYIASILSALDVDGNGAVGALTDALLILRYVFGFRDAVLVNGAVAVDCGRCDADSIEAFIDLLIP